MLQAASSSTTTSPHTMPVLPPSLHPGHWFRGSDGLAVHPPRIATLLVERGQTLGLRVLAEGIEDRATWDALQAMGCHAGQGYFISKPLEPERLLPWMEAYCASLAAARPTQALS
jgi:hypothetical protein